MPPGKLFVVSWRDLRFVRRVADGYFRPIVPAPHKPNPSTWRNDRLTVAWLGHATVLLNLLGVNILADPALRSRVGVNIGPLTLGPKRLVAPGLHVRELPRLDLVLLTHAHMDHLDLGTLRRLPREITVVTAKATADLLAPLGFRDIVELGWGDSRRIETRRGSITIEAFKVQHWGARLRHDMHRGFNGYVLERQERRVCLAGDTANANFEAVGRRGPIDVMAVPIGSYDPWIFSHCTPEQAVHMADQARARFLVPIHHQTFRLSREPLDEPIRRFRRAVKPERIALSQIGQTFEMPESAPTAQPFGGTVGAEAGLDAVATD